jgi:hypothetical protein
MVFALLGLLLTGAASLWLLVVASAGQTSWAEASTDHLNAWLGYAGAGGAIIAGMSALAISLSARERGPVRAFALAALFALVLLFAYASRGGFS